MINPSNEKKARTLGAAGAKEALKLNATVAWESCARGSPLQAGRSSRIDGSSARLWYQCHASWPTTSTRSKPGAGSLLNSTSSRRSDWLALFFFFFFVLTVCRGALKILSKGVCSTDGIALSYKLCVCAFCVWLR